MFICPAEMERLIGTIIPFGIVGSSVIVKLIGIFTPAAIVGKTK